VKRAHPQQFLTGIACSLAGDIVHFGIPPWQAIRSDSVNKCGIVDMVEQYPVPLFAFLQSFLSTLQLGDVAGDTECPHNSAALVTYGYFCRQGPRGSAIQPRLFLDFVDNRLTGANDLLLVFKRGLRAFCSKDVEIRLSDCLARISERH